MKTPFMRGEKVYLRALAEKDANGPYAEWFNDAEVCRGNNHHVFPYTRRDALAYIRSVRKPTDALVLAVVRAADDAHIGNVALQNVHPIHRSAEFAIVIGEKGAWGKGFSKEAARLLLHHGFETFNLHRIHCATFESNLGMQRLAESVGMKLEGRRRAAVYKDGRYLDVLEYGILRDEFLKEATRTTR